MAFPPFPFNPTVARIVLGTGLALAAAAVPVIASAQGFAVFLAPSRFDLQVKAGETRREVLEFHHVGVEAGRYRISTQDWEFQPDYAVRFSEALAPDSCRPWVAIERRELTLSSNARYRYRFEVTPPAGTPARECRFALMVEGLETAKVERETLNFPVAGRIGVIVYVRVGDAAPKLAFQPAGLGKRDGETVPLIEVRNTGNAHGRLEGYLSGKDAAGNAFDLAPESVPILPGMTRQVALRPVAEEGRKLPAIQFPLTVKGSMEWGKSRETLEFRFAP